MRHLTIPKIMSEVNSFLNSRNSRGAGRHRKQRRGRSEIYSDKLLLLLLLLQHLLGKSMNVLFTKLHNHLDFENYRRVLGVDNPAQIPHRHSPQANSPEESKTSASGSFSGTSFRLKMRRGGES